MKSKPNLLVLAAGMGSRYGGLKQMDPMGPHGETVLDYSIYDAIRAGFERVVFIIRRDFFAAFQQKVASRFMDQIAIDYCFQELEDTIGLPNLPQGRTRPWGTAHALWAAREQLQTPFAVINADDFYGQDAYLQMARHLTNQQATELSLVAYPLQNTLSPHGSVNRGLCSCKDGRLHAVEEYSSIAQTDVAITGLNRQGQLKTLTACDSVSMNFWGFPATVFPLLQDYMVDFFKQHGYSLEAECYLPDFVNHLLQKHAHQCQVLPTSSHWFGVTYPEDKGRVQSELQACIQSGDYPKKL